MDNVTLGLFSAVGMMIVAAVFIAYWRRVSKLQFRWFWLGAGLWTIGAVILKSVFALLAHETAIGMMGEHLPYPLFVLAGGLFVGAYSSLSEIGLVLLAVIIWRKLGTDANRAIGIGIGAGAFEAFLLGVVVLVPVCIALAGMPGGESIREEFDAAAVVTPLFWLVPPFERIIAILLHTTSRTLVLLGVVMRKYKMVFWGFLIFTLADGVVGAVIVSEKMGQFSMWWIELAVFPVVIISIPILRWCYRNGGSLDDSGAEPKILSAQQGTPADADNPRR